MDLLKWMYLAISLSVLRCISCGQNETAPQNPRNLKRFQDIPQALNYMYGYLPEFMPMEEKCKRYAVLASCTPNGLPYESTVKEIVMMHNNILNRHYRELEPDKLILLYSTTIDRYRVTQLAPPFIDLIECLKNIDIPEATEYAFDEELVLLLDIYKRILGRTDTVLELEKLDLFKFPQAFFAALNQLFKGFIEVDMALDSAYQPSITITRTLQPGEQLPFYSKRELTDEQIKFRRRERSRLAQRRIRILDAESLRNQNRRSREQRQEKRKRQERLIFTHPANTPEEIEAKRRLQERRQQDCRRRFMKRQQFNIERVTGLTGKHRGPNTPFQATDQLAQRQQSGSIVYEVPPWKQVSQEVQAQPDASLSQDLQQASAINGRRICDADARELVQLMRNIVETYTSTNRPIYLRHRCRMHNTNLNLETGHGQFDTSMTATLATNPNITAQSELEYKEDLSQDDLINCANQLDSEEIMRLLSDDLLGEAPAPAEPVVNPEPPDPIFPPNSSNDK